MHNCRVGVVFWSGCVHGFPNPDFISAPNAPFSLPVESRFQTRTNFVNGFAAA